MMTPEQQSGTTDSISENKNHIIRVSIVRLLIVSGTYWALFSQSPDVSAWVWQLYIFAGALALLGLSAIIGIILARANKFRSALLLSVIALNFNMLLIGLFFEGVGTILALILLLTVGSLVSSYRTRLSSLSLAGSLVVGTIIVLVDILFQGIPWRYDLGNNPFILNFGWLLTIAVFIANVFFFFRQFTNFPLRVKLAISFLMVTIASLWSLSYINSRITEVVLTEQAQESLNGTAKQVRLNVEAFLESNQANIANEAQLPVFSNYLEFPNNSALADQALETLYVLRGRDPEFIISVSLVGSNGQVLLSTINDEIGSNIMGEAFFSEAITQNTATVSPVYFYSLEDARIYFNSPLVTETGLGAIILTYDAAKLQSIIESSNNAIGDLSFAVLFDDNLIHIAHGISPEANYKTVVPFDETTYNNLLLARRIPNGLPEDVFLNFPELQENLELAMSNSSPTFFTAEDVATGDLINQVVAVRLEQNDWILTFFQPQEVFLAPAQTQFRANSLISILITTVVVIVALGLSQVLTNPIVELTKTAHRISSGDFSARSQVNAKDEFGILSGTFNDMAEQLEALITGLEKQVQARTLELETGSNRLRAAAEIARDTSIETDLDLLMQRAVDLISDRLDLYFVGIYMLDEKESFGQLLAGSGEAGKLLIESEHRASLRSATPLSYTLTSGEPRFIQEDDPTLNLIRHPVLPNLKEQLVLPLKVGHDIIGAIDLQSDEDAKLTEADIPVLLIMADQIAVAIQKSQLARQMETTLEELEAAYGRYTQESWGRFSQVQSQTGYRFKQVEVEPIQISSDEIDFAWEQGEIVQHSDENESTLLIPMKVRGQVISVLNLKFDTASVPQDTRLLLEEIGNRLSLVMENARLVENSQKRVEQEQLTNKITTKIRETLDMDTILRTSVEEIGIALNIPEIEIRLGSATDSFSFNGQSAANGSNGKK